MYSRYRQDWEPAREPERVGRDDRGAPSPHMDGRKQGGFSSLLSRFNGMDKGDLLLIAVLVFLLFEGEDKEIVILLGIVIFLGWM